MAATLQPLLLFEQPLARVPYEQLRKGFRTTQRNFERDFGILATSSSEISTLAELNDTETANAAAISSLDAMIARVEGLKARIADVQETTTTPMKYDMRTRIDHLASFEALESTSDPGFAQWADTRMDRWLVDHLLRTNRFETAEALAKEKGIEHLVDIPVFAEIQQIRAALLRQSCTEALAWCSENKAALRKAKVRIRFAFPSPSCSLTSLSFSQCINAQSTLEFDLRVQEFIELVRASNFFPAILYARKHLAPWHDTYPDQFRHVMTLLIYNPSASSANGRGVAKPKNSAYRALFDLERWKALAEGFMETALGLGAMPRAPLLSLALYAGLAALRHPVCIAPPEHDDSFDALAPHSHSGLYTGTGKNTDCPLCDSTGLGVLAREVPSSQHLISSLVCAISGKLMDSENPPMAFRNGYVYSRMAMEEMAARNGGFVTCPRSGQTCHFNELRKVFVT